MPRPEQVIAGLQVSTLEPIRSSTTTPNKQPPHLSPSQYNNLSLSRNTPVVSPGRHTPMQPAAMAEPILPDPSASAQSNDAAFEAFHQHRWDLDKDFLVGHLTFSLTYWLPHWPHVPTRYRTLPLSYLQEEERKEKLTDHKKGGLVLALGGYHALSRTASQADIVMHSRIFYYARVRGGASIPHAPYRAWLRRQLLAGRNPRIWEWDLLTALCDHRDRLASASQADDRARLAADAVVEKEVWLRELLGADVGAGAAAGEERSAAAATPAWMAAAPRGELYVSRGAGAGGEEGTGEGGQVPYPEQFAAIIKAVQSGESIEGIVEIPDVVARNPVRAVPFLVSTLACLLVFVCIQPLIRRTEHHSLRQDGEAAQALGAGPGRARWHTSRERKRAGKQPRPVIS